MRSTAIRTSFVGEEHFDRLLFSCKVARIPSPLTIGRMDGRDCQCVRAQTSTAALIFAHWSSVATSTLGVDGRNCPVDAILASVPWGAYLGAEALENGVDVQVSSWRRMAPDTLNALAKIGGQYVNSQNIVMEAKDNGFTEGIALDVNGYVSEGSGENIFLVHKGEIFTPPLGNSILGGITRNCAMVIARDLGYTITEMVDSRAKCSILPMRSSSPAPLLRSRPCARLIVCRSVAASVAR